MLDITNRTSFSHCLIQSQDHQADEFAMVLIQGTYRIGPAGAPLALAEEQVPPLLADVWHAEPGISSLKYAADTCPPKPATDVAIVGHAYAPGGKATAMDVLLQVGPLVKALRVTGDRHWQRGLLRWTATAPVPFERMPLVWERAFGGADRVHADAARHARDERNPVGTGFCRHGGRKRLAGLPLPNIEDPDHLLTRSSQTPPPAGCGFVARDWRPRRDCAGTYDQAWQEQRAPLLPTDYAPRHGNAASEGFQCEPKLAGGEAVRLVGCSPSGELRFDLPQRAPHVSAMVQDRPVAQRAALDTVLIEPDESRVVLTWRAAIPCTRRFLHVNRVVIKEGR